MVAVMNQMLNKVRNAKYFPLGFDNIASDISQVKQLSNLCMSKCIYFHRKHFFALKNFPSILNDWKELYKSFLDQLKKLNTNKNDFGSQTYDSATLHGKYNQ